MDEVNEHCREQRLVELIMRREDTPGVFRVSDTFPYFHKVTEERHMKTIPEPVQTNAVHHFGCLFFVCFEYISALLFPSPQLVKMQVQHLCLL